MPCVEMQCLVAWVIITHLHERWLSLDGVSAQPWRSGILSGVSDLPSCCGLLGAYTRLPGSCGLEPHTCML